MSENANIKVSQRTHKRLELVERLLTKVDKILIEVEKDNGLVDFESTNPHRQGWTFNMSCDRWGYTCTEALAILVEMKKEKQVLVEENRTFQNAYKVSEQTLFMRREATVDTRTRCCGTCTSQVSDRDCNDCVDFSRWSERSTADTKKIIAERKNHDSVRRVSVE